VAIDKNGLGHRPFGAWAIDEDKLESEAEDLARAQKLVDEKQSPAPAISANVRQS
jgi:hypothetical protein